MSFMIFTGRFVYWVFDLSGLVVGMDFGRLNRFAWYRLAVIEGDGAEILVWSVEFYGFYDELPLILDLFKLF